MPGLRPAQPADLACIASWVADAETLYRMLPRASFPLSVAQLQAVLTQCHGASVLEVDGAPVGFAGFIEHAPAAQATLSSVIVDPARRRQGWGRALIEAMCALAASLGARRINATCFDRNLPALTLYQAAGFQPAGWEMRIDPWQQQHIAFKLTRPLEQGHTVGGICYSDEPERIDFGWLTAQLTRCYWCEGIDEARVRDAAAGSAVLVGAYHGTRQVGYARIVSDRARFAYLADVVVDPTHRGQGIATEMVRTLLAHPGLAQVEHCYLLTRDAHRLYRPLGFEVFPAPERFMRRSRPA
ncbi:GNAT family N-acetyltransferase [Chitiniphilus purpureus]|uniref:GNAT family N-acetyltransferase n=1 Tax=Chitiniphilus purpureus TaxID=2981137 RepID=A0ABY6DP77_9NEIS|nr:GNAT family N-acetyltransferase [Chitiniphilus sp. CD1]UXY16175.1 GNAT family N-acetyltransferase [Chitiniphilus sp. CD1]